MNAYIKDIAYYLPVREVTNEAIVRDFPEWSVEKIASKVGVEKRYVAAEDETATDMAIKASECLFENGNIKREEIDFVMFCTQSPDYKLPTSACIIQHQLGLRKGIGALDFNLGCSGYVYGLSLAKGLIMGGIATHVLLLTGETYNKYLHPRDKGNRTIFGDAASATVVSTTGIAKIGEFSLGTDGSGAGNLIVKSGGSRMPEKQNDIRFDENGNPLSSDFLYMNGSEIFTFTLDNVPPLVNDTLVKNCLEKDAVNQFVFHQANKYMLNFLRKKLKIEPDRFYCCLSQCGNTVSNSIPIALREAMNDGTINRGENVLIAGFGVGYSWGGTVLRFL
ncbi:3-oxoacyl-ACP synthase III family protein [uncultured Parabacteroides sp.]|jgi:3-oxoacyl-[acyl-carrier-protein] synthase-3|uniref:3-oxoacyl-ACP synthase III family protein n=1 Tax=uncultured Parabacteroides sp. TaxID=512312 RepID=UPI0025F0F0DD|nr:ketoacyl-ACP synthase III [uncultured Parabacteroides sp.]